MEIALEEYFQNVYKSVNFQKKILRCHYYCTNVEKPTLKTIKEYLKSIEKHIPKYF